MSSGAAKGIPTTFEGCYARNNDRSKILVVDDFAPYRQGRMGDVGGCVIESSSMISHAAIIASQLGVPCVGNFGSGLLEHISRASFLRVHGSTGVVEAWY